MRYPIMHEVTITIPDDAYAAANNRAQQEGFDSTEVFLSNLLISSIAPESDNYDHLFTPEVIADLDGISATIKAGGKTYSMEEVREHFSRKRTEWLASHPS